jgi:hypothetical protein
MQQNQVGLMSGKTNVLKFLKIVSLKRIYRNRIVIFNSTKLSCVYRTIVTIIKISINIINTIKYYTCAKDMRN